MVYRGSGLTLQAVKKACPGLVCVPEDYAECCPRISETWHVSRRVGEGVCLRDRPQASLQKYPTYASRMEGYGRATECPTHFPAFSGEVATQESIGVTLNPPAVDLKGEPQAKERDTPSKTANPTPKPSKGALTHLVQTKRTACQLGV